MEPIIVIILVDYTEPRNERLCNLECAEFCCCHLCSCCSVCMEKCNCPSSTSDATKKMETILRLGDPSYVLVKDFYASLVYSDDSDDTEDDDVEID